MGMMYVDIKRQIKTQHGLLNLAVKAHFPYRSTTTLYGPSGGGKTTFLKILAGLIRPDAGEVTIDNDIWFSHTKQINQSPQQRKTGFVFQDYALFPNMTVRQHLQYASKDTGLLQRLLHLGQLERLANHKPQQLSGGQQQRLAILRAIALQPKVLLMDEPFSALDHELRSVLIQDLHQLLQEFQCTCLIVSHSPAELAGISQHQLKINATFSHTP